MTRRTLFAAFVPLVLLLAACSSSGGATASPPASVAPSTPASVAPSTPASVEPSMEPSESAGPSAESGIELKVADGGATLGQYLTEEDGKTLYMFTNDTKDSGKSTCNGDCATNWPPLLADSADAVKLEDGVTGTVSIVTRDDGSKQVAYNGQPLYYFAGDSAAGDTNGQGVGDKWFVVKP
jgi:predicted lipoprotein with Yx(FWY)xxD motif